MRGCGGADEEGEFGVRAGRTWIDDGPVGKGGCRSGDGEQAWRGERGQ